jgi:hypothetical protein
VPPVAARLTTALIVRTVKFYLMGAVETIVRTGSSQRPETQCYNAHHAAPIAPRARLIKTTA